MNSLTMMKRPSAYLPVAMSFLALATVVSHVAIFGVAREADEGIAAHIFQLLSNCRSSCSSPSNGYGRIRDKLSSYWHYNSPPPSRH
jgi:hypothetical protein